MKVETILVAICGALIAIFTIVLVAGSEDQVIAEKCDYAGKVKLGSRIYECKRVAGVAS